MRNKIQGRIGTSTKGTPPDLKVRPPPLGKSHFYRVTPAIAGRNVELYERQKKACAMARQGATYEMIAEALGYSDRGDAWRDINLALKETREQCKDEASELLTLQLEKLKALEVQANAILRDAAADQKTKLLAIDKILKIHERHAKLLGLDAAQRFELTGAAGAPIAVAVTHEEVLGRLETIRKRLLGSEAAPRGVNGGANGAHALGGNLPEDPRTKQ